MPVVTRAAAPSPPQVYFPYLLMNKKRYAGLLWTNPDKHDKMDAKVGGFCGGREGAMGPSARSVAHVCVCGILHLFGHLGGAGAQLVGVSDVSQHKGKRAKGTRTGAETHCMCGVACRWMPRCAGPMGREALWSSVAEGGAAAESQCLQPCVGLPCTWQGLSTTATRGGGADTACFLRLLSFTRAGH